jgi:hypothetical protein
MTVSVTGCDLCRAWLDLHRLREGGTPRIANTPDAIAARASLDWASTDWSHERISAAPAAAAAIPVDPRHLPRETVELPVGRLHLAREAPEALAPGLSDIVQRMLNLPPARRRQAADDTLFGDLTVSGIGRIGKARRRAPLAECITP